MAEASIIGALWLAFGLFYAYKRPGSAVSNQSVSKQTFVMRRYYKETDELAQEQFLLNRERAKEDLACAVAVSADTRRGEDEKGCYVEARLDVVNTTLLEDQR